MKGNTNENSTGTKIKAILGFHGVGDMDAVKSFSTVYQGLLNNSAYSTPPVALPTFKSGIDLFNSLIIDAEDGGKKAVSAKDKQRVAMIQMYTQLGHYVEAACNNDPAVSATSGFTARSTKRTTPQPLTGAAFDYIDRGPNSGQAVVKAASQSGAVAFDVRYALKNSDGTYGTWTIVTLTNSRKMTVNGLTQGGIYQFQIRALGKLGYTDWTDTKTFVSA